jgi:hypothetical protein
MISFLIKKTFYDLWDNLFRIILLNLGFIISLAIPILIPGFLQHIPVLPAVITAAGVLWCFIYLAAAAISVKAVSDYGVFGFTDFLANLKEGWLTGLFMCLAVFFFFIVIRVVIPFYLKMDSFVGIILGGLLFWTLVLTVISFQFIFAIRARLDTKLIKIIKKSFIIFFDNPGFSIFSALYTFLMLILSLVFIFLLPGLTGLLLFLLLLPGPAGLLLFLDEGLRLRLMKYDWLEANPPDTDTQNLSRKTRRQIPWDALLIEEREKTGHRTLRNLIFPWRD